MNEGLFTENPETSNYRATGLNAGDVYHSDACKFEFQLIDYNSIGWFCSILNGPCKLNVRKCPRGGITPLQPLIKPMPPVGVNQTLAAKIIFP